VIDESHLLAPESGHGSSVALDAFKDLMARGRKRGLCPVLATQRLGKLSKSVASEAQNLIIGGTTIDVDRERASEAFGVSKAGKPAFFQHLRHFDPGEFFAMGPALPTRDPYRFKSGGVMTSHARFVGGFKQLSARKTAAAFSILLKELKEVPTEAKEEAETLQSLRAEVAKLKAGALDPAVAQKFTIQIQTLGAEKASLQQQLVQTRGELDDLKSAVQRGLSLVGDLGRVFEMNLGVSRQAVAPAPTRTPVTVPPKVRHRSKRPRL
jgi:hypothetical protein